MATPPLSDETALRTFEAYQRNNSSWDKTAEELGIGRATVGRHVKHVHENGLLETHGEPDVILPEFPSDDIDVQQLIELQCKRFEKRAAAAAARTWFPVKFKSNLPIGIVFFGDPHVDNNGCNWPLLRKHVELCANTAGIHAINMGDTTDNWTGRLMKLYANSDTSVSSARKLAEWFMLDSGVNWLLWLIGNHDAWNDGAEVLNQMAKRYKTKPLAMHDWVARFQVEFPNGWQTRVIAAHNFKGHSQWNPLHGPMKAGQMGADAHLLVCAHRHNWAKMEWENADRGYNQIFMRVRGYKDIDSYAHRGMFPEQFDGASMMVVFDPARQQMTGFEDVERGAEYLTMLREAA